MLATLFRLRSTEEPDSGLLPQLLLLQRPLSPKSTDREASPETSGGSKGQWSRGGRARAIEAQRR
jgi:hypothetical protein